MLATEFSGFCGSAERVLASTRESVCFDGSTAIGLPAIDSELISGVQAWEPTTSQVAGLRW